MKERFVQCLSIGCISTLKATGMCSGEAGQWMTLQGTRHISSRDNCCRTELLGNEKNFARGSGFERIFWLDHTKSKSSAILIHITFLFTIWGCRDHSEGITWFVWTGRLLLSSLPQVDSSHWKTTLWIEQKISLLYEHLGSPFLLVIICYACGIVWIHQYSGYG